MTIVLELMGVTEECDRTVILTQEENKVSLQVGTRGIIFFPALVSETKKWLESRVGVKVTLSQRGSLRGVCGEVKNESCQMFSFNNAPDAYAVIWVHVRRKHIFYFSMLNSRNIYRSPTTANLNYWPADVRKSGKLV